MSTPGIWRLPSPHTTPVDVDAAAAPLSGAEASPAIDDADARWDALTLCAAGYILTSVGRVHQLFPILEFVHPAVISALIAIVIFVGRAFAGHRWTHLVSPTTKLLAAILLWMTLSVTGALRPGASFNLVFDNFAKTALMSIVVIAAVRGFRDMERLVCVYLVGAAVYSAIIVTRFDLGEGAKWRLGHLYYYDANDFATFMVTAMPFGIYFLQGGRRMMVRLFAAISLCVLTLGFVWSGSRGGFIALSAVGAFILARYSTIPLRRRVWATALIALALLLTASDQYWQQMGTIMSDADYNHTSESGRLQIWNRGIGYMLDNPIFGLGPDNFAAAEGTISPLAERQQYGIGVPWSAPHNSFVQVGAELGFPGLALYVAIIVSAFAALRRAGRHERAFAEMYNHSPLTPTLTASLLGFVVGSFFLSLAYSEMLYTLVALAVGLEKVANDAVRG